MDVDLALRAGRSEMDRAQPFDEFVIESREIRRLEVGVDPLRPQRIEERLHHLIRHRAEQVGDRLRDLTECANELLAPLGRAAADGDERRDLLSVPFLREHRQRRRSGEVDERRDLARRVPAQSRNVRSRSPAVSAG